MICLQTLCSLQLVFPFPLLPQKDLVVVFKTKWKSTKINENQLRVFYFVIEYIQKAKKQKQSAMQKALKCRASSKGKRSATRLCFLLQEQLNTWLKLKFCVKRARKGYYSHQEQEKGLKVMSKVGQKVWQK